MSEAENFRYDGMMHALLMHSLKKDPLKRVGGGLVNYRAADEVYTYNGIANKIISVPANDAVGSGFYVADDGHEVEGNAAIMSLLEDLGYENSFSTALSWDRLYGGGVILMLVNDGGTLEDPLDEGRIKNVERLEVYTPEDISFTEDYTYSDPLDPNFGKPQFYTITGYYGNQFLVHESRLLIFRGATLSNYSRRVRNGWGGTVLEQVEADVSAYKEGLHLALEALRRLSQGVLKLNNAEALLMNADGEQQLQARLQMIDMYRHLENTIALGSADEYDIKNLSLTGIKDLLEKFQDALSASTCIPSTVLFGRSPAGMSATGKSDMENYYNMVDRIRNRTLKPNLMRLVYILSLAGDYGIKLPEQWNIQFKPLWNASEKEAAEVKKMEADAMVARANAANTYLQNGALDGKEVRSTLLETKDFIMDASLDAALLRTPEGE